jgi:hypothetical protein
MRVGYLLAGLVLVAQWRTCTVTTYSARHDGHRTANGEVYRHQTGMTCAVSRDLRHLMGREITVAWRGRSVRVRVNDVTAARFRDRVDLNGRSWRLLSRAAPSRIEGRWRR